MIDHIFVHFGIRAISIPFRYKYEVACKYSERNINYLSIDQLFNSILTIRYKSSSNLSLILENN